MRRGYLVLIILGAVFLIVFNLPTRWTQPIRGLAREGTAVHQGALTRFTGRVQAFFSSLGQGPELLEERDQAREQVRALQAEFRKRDTIQRENEELRRLLQMPRPAGYAQKACQVIAREDASGWWHTVGLDKGLAHGLGTNQLVVTAAGVVGRTLAASARTCDVLLMTDRNFLLSVRFPDSGVFGVLRGGGVLEGESTRLDVLCAPAPARADFIHKEAWIQAGDRVVTSGLGGRYPPDILVGYVQQVTTNRAGLYLEAKVVPAADLGRLRFVSVLVPPG